MEGSWRTADDVRYRRTPTLDPLERLERVQRVSETALAHLSVDGLLDELLVRVRKILDADTAAVPLLDESRNKLVARAAQGIEEEVDRGVRIPVGKGFAGRIAAERAPVALHRVDHSTVLNPILFQEGTRSLLGVPLLAHGDVVGVMHVGFNDALKTTSGDVLHVIDRAISAEWTGHPIQRAPFPSLISISPQHLEPAIIQLSQANEPFGTDDWPIAPVG
jgi:transcriptional regulator with GAF, ATPase, and Fis domain